MAGPRRLKELVSSASERMTLPDGELVVALSGGADSAALAYLVLSGGRKPRALHVDHGLAYSATMRAAAKAIADEIGIALEVVETVVDEGPSPEARAREARYRAFGEGTGPDDRLLTGHTADDSAETVLINLIRGTGPTGLTGIPSFRPPNVYRPILALGRAETREIAALGGLSFVDDPMNLDPNITRNLVRRQMIPVLSQINPSLLEAIGRLSRQVRDDDELLDRLAGELRPRLEDDLASIPVGVLVTSPRPLADRVLAKMIAHVAGSDRVEVGAVERAWSVAHGDSGRQEIAAGASANREGPLLVISAGADDSRADGADEVDLSDSGRVLVGSLVFEVAARNGVCRVAPLSRWLALFPAGTRLTATPEGMVLADGEPAWVPGGERLPVAWYEPGASGYLVVSARRKPGWTSSR
ncbi:MAG: tRNA lysidine(34) synthetase TilS [Actinobacteria bacterium]|nr:tRNA lysidine(34) synthetase TilS [Actinomycetota bacterium]